MRRNAGWSRQLGADVYLRPETSDAQVAADTFTGRYHVPPVTITPRTVLDCGANIGLVAADYRRMWPDAKIVAVEPDAGNVAVARTNFGGLVIQTAVSKHNGFAGLVTDGLAEEAYRLSQEPTGHPVPCATVAHLVNLYLDGFCDLLKLDIEGEEENVLRDRAWKEMVGAVLVECHEQINGYGAADAIEDLLSLGFDTILHDVHPQAVWAWKP